MLCDACDDAWAGGFVSLADGAAESAAVPVGAGYHVNSEARSATECARLLRLAEGAAETAAVPVGACGHENPQTRSATKCARFVRITDGGDQDGHGPGQVGGGRFPYEADHRLLRSAIRACRVWSPGFRTKQLFLEMPRSSSPKTA